MSILREMFGGQRRITPDRELQPRYSGKTVLTSNAPVPLSHRIAMFLFCSGFAALGYVLLGRSRGFGSSIVEDAKQVWLIILIAFSVVVGVLALAGLPPFRSKRRK